MEKYGKRVAAARKHVGWSGAKLARELGIKQPSLHELENGDATGSKHSFKIAQKTGVNIAWLETGEGEMIGPSLETGPSVPPREITIPELNFHSMPRDVPILGGASCGENGLFELNGQVHDHARRTPRLIGIKDVYALYIEGDSMIPWRDPGELVYVHPNQPVKIGDYVVVQLHPEKEGAAHAAYIKKLIRRTATSIVLHQFNPAKDLTIPLKKIDKIHRVMPWSEVLGF